MGKRAIIIGAGMAGLSAAVHLQNNGFSTLLFEASSSAGGLVTAWKRGRYTFDGSVHWIPGCRTESPFYAINDELFDMSKLSFVRHETVMDVECLGSSGPDGDRFFHLYCNIDLLEQYMLAISPEDRKTVEEFTALARVLTRYNLPPTTKPFEVQGILDKVKLIGYLPLISHIKKMSRYSIKGFAAQFSHPFLREAFERLSLGREYPIVVVIMQVAFGHLGTSAYPLGGSSVLTSQTLRRYRELGGEIRLGQRVEEILVEKGSAVGVRLSGGEAVRSEIVVSAADGRWTVMEALKGAFLSPALEELYAGKRLDLFESLLYVSLGIARRFDGLPHQQVLALQEPVELCDGSVHTHVMAHIVNYDPSFAPANCTVINVMLSTWKDAFWSDLRKRDRAAYAKAKESVKDFVVDTLEAKLGDIRERVEEWDVATPATYIRYTGNWHGSIQGWLPPKDFLAARPLAKELPGIENFYMVGQWVEPGGGITPAVKTGRDVAWIACSRDRKKFVTGLNPSTSGSSGDSVIGRKR
ncbi:MAG TPA: NAD(P)/FAD-dependent oxidoreductase [Spirochaetia bacterium]|nr:NAD(P)/FAD-dependent oxidoreductase [Spirochaetia bacterium]